MSKRTKLELNITSTIFFIEIIIGIIIKINIYEIASSANTADHLIIAYLAFTGVFNISYGIILMIINSNHIEKSKADKQEKIESQVDESNTNKL